MFNDTDEDKKDEECKKDGGFPTSGHEGHRLSPEVYKELMDHYCPENDDHTHYEDPDSTLVVDIVDREQMLPMLIETLKNLGKYDEYKEFAEENRRHPNLSSLCLAKVRDLMYGTDTASSRLNPVVVRGVKILKSKDDN